MIYILHPFLLLQYAPDIQFAPVLFLKLLQTTTYYDTYQPIILLRNKFPAYFTHLLPFFYSLYPLHYSFPSAYMFFISSSLLSTTSSSLLLSPSSLCRLSSPSPPP